MNNNKCKKYRFTLKYIPYIVIVIAIIMGILFGINFALNNISYNYNKKLQIENKNFEKAEKLIEKELGINKKFMYIDLEDESCGTVQTKGKEYKVIFYTEKIKGEKEWYEPIRIKNIVQLK
ncbi:hypothetical protein CF067_17005 [Clostridium sporogenes]|uniref:Uncharacterized protein n=1 Tax=Clostridium botulinum B str. Osaka05 TaxID=1407017 RepID=A0A060N695_CLOBO|nr:hypothetical protein [Clostridium botulinum]BAO05105.1 uncharacterized protein CBO05P2_080 [Clostridium botulinum B str. Osaka05]